MKTAKQMFGAVTRQLAATERAVREDAADRIEEQDRLDETLTRREVIEALESVARSYTNGAPEAQRIADAFKELAEALS